jgi:hypothetical protein
MFSGDTLGPGMKGSDIGMAYLGYLIGDDNVVGVHTNSNSLDKLPPGRPIPFEVNPVTGEVTRASVPNVIHMYMPDGPGQWSKIIHAASGSQQKLNSGDILGIRNRPR